MEKPLHLKLITTDKSFKTWRTAKKKLAAVRDELLTMQNVSDVIIDVEYRPLIPAVHNGRITHEWMDSISEPIKQAGIDFVAIHMSNEQRKKWGIQPTLNGAYQLDTDTINELYFWADEYTRRMGRNQFEQVFLHEMRHAITKGLDVVDDTHDIHYKKRDIRGSFSQFDFAEYNPARRNLQFQVKYLSLAVKYLGQLVRMVGIEVPTNRQRLLSKARQMRGLDASPDDRVSDVVGCAESVTTILSQVIDFPIITGTWTLWDALEKDPRFKRVTVPMPGDIIISPTGMGGSKSVPNGHVGIVGVSGKVMSNSSYSGYWDVTHTLDSWREIYQNRGGYKIFFYSLIN